MHKEKLDFGYTLSTLRQQKGLTQKELARLVSEKCGDNITRDNIASYESNRSEPRYYILVSISEVLGYSIEYMMRFTELSEDEYNDNFDIVSGLVDWGLRNKDKVYRLLYITNLFEGDSDGIFVFAYMYSRMRVKSRLHIANDMDSVFKLDFLDGKLDLEPDEYDRVMEEYEYFRGRLAAKYKESKK